MADILSRETRADGSTRLTVGTADLGLANIVVPSGMEDDPALARVAELVSDYARLIQPHPRGNAKDDRRRGIRRAPQNAAETDSG